MMESRSRKDGDDDDALFDPADVREASAFESQDGGKGRVGSFLRIVRKTAKRKRFWLAVALFGSAFLLYAMRHYGYFAPDSIVWFLRSHPVIAPFVFVIAYAVMVGCLVPTLPLNLGAGLIWGPYWGGLLTVIGASAGAAGAFWIARYLASDYLNKKFNHSAWTWLRDEIQHKEWKAVAFTRINPIFPFGPSSYFFGVTEIGFGRYIVTTVLSILPLCLLFAAIGSSIGSLVFGDDAYALMRNVVTVSLALTTIVVGRIVLKRYAEQRAKTKQTIYRIG